MFCRILWLIAGCWFSLLCAQSDNTLLPVFRHAKTSPLFDGVLLQKDKYRLQIIYTQIDRNAENKPILKHFYLNPAAHYNYGENTWTLPLAILALEKVNSLHQNKVSKNDTLIVTPENCPTAENEFRQTIAQLIKEMLLTNDPTAFNALVDFVTPEYANNRMKELGYPTAMLAQKSSPCNDMPLKATNPTMIIAKDVVKYQQNRQKTTKEWTYKGSLKPEIGKAFVGSAIVIRKPKNLSEQNYLSITDLHDLLCSVIFPQLQKVEKKLQLSSSDISLIRKYMAMLPAESNSPPYNPATFDDTYKKFYINKTTTRDIPDNLRVFNVSGMGYGFVTDCSYFTDTLNKVEFILAASLYANNSDLVKEENFEYQTLAFPFLEELFNTFYTIELNRKKQRDPVFDDDDFDDKKPIVSKTEKIKKNKTIAIGNPVQLRLQKLYDIAADTSGIEEEHELAAFRQDFDRELVNAYTDTTSRFSANESPFIREKISDDKLCKTVSYSFAHPTAEQTHAFVTLSTKTVAQTTVAFSDYHDIAIQAVYPIYGKLSNSYVVEAFGRNKQEQVHHIFSFIKVDKNTISAKNNFIIYKKPSDLVAVPFDGKQNYLMQLNTKKREIKMPVYMKDKKKPVWQKLYLSNGVFSDMKSKK